MNKHQLLTGFFFVLSLCTIIVSLLYGSYSLRSLSDSQSALIFYELRVPRVLCSFLVGGALSVIGLVTQSLLRNPLACPYTLGSSQLFSLVFFSYMFLTGPILIWLVLLVFSFVSLIVFFLLRSGRRIIDYPHQLILLGVSLGLFCSSLILALQFFVDGISLIQMTRWMMGSLSVVGLDWLFGVLTVSLLITMSALHFARDLDWLQLGEELAVSKGVNVRGLYLFWICVLFVGLSVLVYYVGPIGFVGLIIPHLVRLFGIRQHIQAIPIIFMAGGSFLTLCDLLSRTILGATELPVGVITGLLGAPLLIIMLLNHSLKYDGKVR